MMWLKSFKIRGKGKFSHKRFCRIVQKIETNKKIVSKAQYLNIIWLIPIFL